MLASLHIENIALIRKLDLELAEGFCAFTGETGAGKSILIDAIGLLCGARGERELIRSGEDYALVEGMFFASQATENALEALDILPDEDGSYFLQRRMSADGRSIAKIGGRTVPLAKLREAASYLLNIHGQQDTQTLSDEDRQRDLLDRFASDDLQLNAYREAYRNHARIKREMRDLTERAEALEERRDLLSYQVQELTHAKLRAGEEAELTAEHALLANSEKVVENAHEAYGSLYAEEDSALAQLKRAMAAVGRLAPIVPECKEYFDRLDDVKAELTDIAESISPLTSDREDCAGRLDAVEARLDKLSALQRKYKTDEQGLIDKLAKAKADLSLLENNASDMDGLKKELASAKLALKEAAEALHLARIDAASVLSERVQTELAELDMPKVRFLIRVEEGGFTPDGADAIDFSVSANAGEAPKPIGKIASGGELSRIMLCLQCVLADVENIPTLIFDEIDTGISGKTNEKIGHMMKRIAKSGNTQVVCVTHAAQLAARASHHYFISKSEQNGRTQTDIKLLDKDGRIGELARIMGGLQVTDAVKLAAEELLEG
ncbi:MAG: DNA repair protein RecN [Clostridia bacterium]|nr:DNA repair protein RecN [Clostridia bacterium]